MHICSSRYYDRHPLRMLVQLTELYKRRVQVHRNNGQRWYSWRQQAHRQLWTVEPRRQRVHRRQWTVEAPGTAPTIVPGGTGQDVVRGSRATHLAMEYSLGGVAAYLGYSQNKANGSSGKDKTTHYGLRGALGDTGLTFRAMARNKQSADGTNSNPWLVGVSKGLDGGAAIHFEHANNDDGKSGKSRLGLHVGF